MNSRIGFTHARGQSFGALLLCAVLAVPSFAQTVQPNAAAPADPAADNKIPVEAAEKPAGGTIELSPFTVVSNNKGYFQSNTMSGTRLNSKIEDLGQSITVMTKEQMSDFAMLDINDVFDHMASTEGTNSYSEFITDRTGAVVDNVSLSPNTANRVRGIGNANIAFNNIATSGRVPIDPLWLDSLELSRGPNANIFGLGNASGTVNQVPATANLTRDFNKAEVRVDSYEGYRGSIDINRMLIPNKLSVRASYAYQHTGFIRQPAGEDSRRLSFQAKYQPFKNTTLSASWYNYKNAAVRPNFTTPRDYYTDWFKAGKPAWNAATGLVTFADGRVYGNGNVLGSSTAYTAAPSFTNVAGVPITFVFGGAESRSPFFIGAPGQDSYWTMARYTSGALATSDPFGAAAFGVGLLTTGPAETFTATQQPLYNSVARPINDQSIYDWTSINLAGNSKAWDDVNTYLAQIDQVILNTPKHTLAAQATFLREDAERMENQPMGPASVNSNVGQLQVDVNQVRLDGTPNPYFGRPYLRSSEPFKRDKPLLWDTGRVQAVYRVDFSQDKGLTKWLGTQQLLGYYEYKDQQNRNYTYRHVALDRTAGWQQKYAPTLLALQTVTNTDPRYLINGTAIAGNYARLNEQYYVGNTPSGGIEYAPSYFPEGISLPYVWGPNASSMIRDTSTVGWAPGQGGGLNNLNSVIKTSGGVLQSTFLEGKLVGTFGSREDIVNDRNAPLALMTAGLRDYDFAESNRWINGIWRRAQGKTTSMSVVGRPFQDLKFLKSRVNDGSGLTRFLAEAASSLSLTYNKSDNFIAQGPAYDLFLAQLPNQTGTDVNYGAWMTMLDGRLSIRYNHFDTKQLDLRNGDISTMAQRILRYEGFVANDSYNLRSQSTAWLNGVGSGNTGATATNAQIAAAIKMPLEQYNGLVTIATSATYAAVNDARATGHELEINYNPTKHWTVSASVTQTKSVNTAAGAAVDEYIAARMPVWTTLEDPRFTQTGATLNGVFTPYSTGPVNLPVGATGHLLWWNIVGAPFTTLAGYNGTQSPAINFLGNVDAPMAVFRALIGRPRPQVREYSAKFNTRYTWPASATTRSSRT